MAMGKEGPMLHAGSIVAVIMGSKYVQGGKGSLQQMSAAAWEGEGIGVPPAPRG